MTNQVDASVFLVEKETCVLSLPIDIRKKLRASNGPNADPIDMDFLYGKDSR